MADRRKSQDDKQSKVTYEQLAAHVIYDPETGAFYRKMRVDRPDCYLGYKKVQITIDGKRHWIKAHRAAFLLMTGKWPKEYIDHIDGERSNNSWKNLREATHAENTNNAKKRLDNKTGYKGVFYRKDMKKWTSSIHHNGKRIHLGTFGSPEIAYKAYCDISKSLKGKFFRCS